MSFPENTLTINGAIKYQTQEMTFCCPAIIYALYRSDFIYDSNGLKECGEKNYLDSCPFCGKAVGEGDGITKK